MEAEGPTVSLSWRSSWDSSTTMKVGSEFGHCPPPRTWPVAEGHALEVDRVMRESICQEQTDITRFSPVSLLRPEETTLPSVWCVHSWLGAVISHVMENREEKNRSPSRTFTASEHNYSQIEKEAMSIVFGVKKFAASLRCWQITSPSIMIFDPQTGVPLLPETRL